MTGEGSSQFNPSKSGNSETGIKKRPPLSEIIASQIDKLAPEDGEKADQIRNAYILRAVQKHPDFGPDELQAWLAEEGIDVSEDFAAAAIRSYRKQQATALVDGVFDQSSAVEASVGIDPEIAVNPQTLAHRIQRAILVNDITDPEKLENVFSGYLNAFIVENWTLSDEELLTKLRAEGVIFDQTGLSMCREFIINLGGDAVLSSVKNLEGAGAEGRVWSHSRVKTGRTQPNKSVKGDTVLTHGNVAFHTRPHPDDI